VRVCGFEAPVVAAVIQKRLKLAVLIFSLVTAAGAATPLDHQQSGSEPARLMAWHSGPLLFLVLLEPSGPAASSCAAVTASLSEVVSGPAAALAASLAAELPAKHLWHVQGLRYLYQDHLAAAVR
jgi:hypothetical protein